MCCHSHPEAVGWAGRVLTGRHTRQARGTGRSNLRSLSVREVICQVASHHLRLPIPTGTWLISPIAFSCEWEEDPARPRAEQSALCVLSPRRHFFSAPLYSAHPVGILPKKSCSKAGSWFIRPVLRQVGGGRISSPKPRTHRRLEGQQGVCHWASWRHFRLYWYLGWKLMQNSDSNLWSQCGKRKYKAGKMKTNFRGAYLGYTE